MAWNPAASGSQTDGLRVVLSGRSSGMGIVEEVVRRRLRPTGTAAR